MKNLTQINFQNIKNVGIRVDFNVPINDSFQITDNTRLIRAKDTMDFISENERFFFWNFAFFRDLI